MTDFDAALPSASSSSSSSLSSSHHLHGSSISSSSTFDFLSRVTSSDFIHRFDFVYNETALSSVWVLSTAPLYFLILLLLKKIVEWRGKPFHFNALVIGHNWFLSVVSMVLLIFMVLELGQMMNRTSFFSVFCDVEGRHSRGSIYYLYFINYLLKYVELWDTVLLCLRGKPTPFLHVYHHAATLLLCWTQLLFHSCVQWVPITINLFIHVIMYAYYALHAMGVDVWWKKYLTTMQIIQFVFALIGCFGGFVPRLMHEFSNGARGYNCHGNVTGGWIGVGILFSYLLLFIRFYQQTYQQRRSYKGKRIPSADREGHENGSAKKTD